jgi:multicomponent Na+:H+ antiporter subunit E
MQWRCPASLAGWISSERCLVRFVNGAVGVFRVPLGSLGRTAGFLAFWVILAGVDPKDLWVGAFAAIAATWTSLRLLPPGQWRFRPIALSRLALRFLYQSVVGGMDVARRALDPRLPLRPGFVSYPVRFAPGAARNTFASLTGLLPGTVPAGEVGGQLIYHCLDVGLPVVSSLASEEAALFRACCDD